MNDQTQNASTVDALSELRVKVAELCGTAHDELGIRYKDGMTSFGQSEEYTRQKCANYQRQGLGCELVTRRTTEVDYIDDLNACAEFEKKLNAKQKHGYADALYKLVPESSDGYIFIWSATAEQRCRAFVATMEESVAKHADSVKDGNANQPAPPVTPNSSSPASAHPVAERDAMNEIRFFVSGHPAPGGSKTGFAIKKGGIYTGRVAIIDAGGQRTKDWRQAVSAAAMEAMRIAGSVPLTGAIEVEFLFQIQRPKSHYRSNGVQLKPGAPSCHITRPDCLKLARSTEDAMTGKCYADDAQIAREVIEKAFSDSPGCWITIREVQK